MTQAQFATCRILWLLLRAKADARREKRALYQRSIFGDLIDFAIIDNRRYRSPAACRSKEDGGGQVVMVRAKLSNPVIITGDIHSFWVNDVKENFSDPHSATVATELVGTSISSAGVPYDQFAAMLPDNPHIKFFDSRRRGYMLCDVGRKALIADLRVVDEIRDPQTKGSSLAKFAIEAGKPGAVRA